MKTRIYTVTNTETKKVRMVRAPSAAAAIGHVSRGLLSCIVTDTDSGIVNRGLGIEVESIPDPKAEPAAEPTPEA